MVYIKFDTLKYYQNLCYRLFKVLSRLMSKKMPHQKNVKLNVTLSIHVTWFFKQIHNTQEILLWLRGKKYKNCNTFYFDNHGRVYLEFICIKLHVQGSFHKDFTGPLTVAAGPLGKKNCNKPPSCVLLGRGLFVRAAQL